MIIQTTNIGSYITEHLLVTVKLMTISSKMIITAFLFTGTGNFKVSGEINGLRLYVRWNYRKFCYHRIALSLIKFFKQIKTFFSEQMMVYLLYFDIRIQLAKQPFDCQDILEKMFWGII